MAAVSLADTPDLHRMERAPIQGQRWVWNQPDGARVFCQVLAVGDGWVRLRRHFPGGRVSVRRERLPLRLSMIPYRWTTTDLLEMIV